jgi:hypothetical protein
VLWSTASAVFFLAVVRFCVCVYVEGCVTISTQTSRRCLTDLIGFMESASRTTGRSRLPQLQGTWQVLSTSAAALYRNERHDAVLSAVPYTYLGAQ